ncbi:MAG: YajQ family cyclic di-GMP-binding protein [Deltaproteobacteria bacterium]|nr:YajQ family cyclic di-GMP-binding protein [Deltaproteobacteria bacterium]
MPSFDILSEVDLQEMDNAVNQAVKEIVTRYDFRGSKSSINFDKEKKILHLIADDDFKMKAVIDILEGKVIKRGISLKSLQQGKIEDSAGGLKKCDITLVMGIDTDKAREIVKLVKDSKMKVQAQIQEKQVRVSGKKKDDLQEAMALIRGRDFGIPLQFGNYRD